METNKEHQPLPSRERFETVNRAGKLVRDGIFLDMKNLGDNPETIAVQGDDHMQSIIQLKVSEEFNEFVVSSRNDNQIDEAADFLAAWDLFIKSGIEVTQSHSQMLGSFQRLLHERQISMHKVEYARLQKAKRRGEFNGMHVVKAVEVTNPNRFKYYDSDQWEEAPLSDATSYLG